LPQRWRRRGAGIYYRVPPGLEHLWDGYKEFRLGSTLTEAYKTWADRLGRHEGAGIQTVGDLLNWYVRAIVPEKANRTQAENYRSVSQLRRPFQDMPVDAIEPHHARQYFERRKGPDGHHAPTAARHEIEILRHAYSCAVERLGLPRSRVTGTPHNPLRGELRLPRPQRRERYVEDWEVLEALRLSAKRRSGSVRACQAYIRLKLLTGLRQTDLLLLRRENLRDDGIYVQPRKTAKTSGRAAVYEWTDALRAAVDEALSARPVDIGPWLFCNRRGECYVQQGRPSGWESMWQRFMRRVVTETSLKDAFAERDLRAKAGSDADSLQRAQELLQHAGVATTQRWYRRRPDRVRPAR
jgi:integrase